MIAADLGYTATNWVGGLMAVAALATALFSAALERRTAAPADGRDPVAGAGRGGGFRPEKLRAG
ncbi:hypothetical protein NKH77_26495 [Streptomyces sp. M19]